MPISTWIRDIFGIRKDLIDTRKSKLEVKQLEDYERARHLFATATMDDIERYDPKVQKLRRKVGNRDHNAYLHVALLTIRLRLIFFILFLVLLTLAFAHFVVHWL